METDVSVAGASSPRTLRRWVVAPVVVAALVLCGLVLGASEVGDSHDRIAPSGGLLDADDDGISDAVETGGWMTRRGDVFVTEPGSPDSDGDGLSDGEEAGAMVTDPQYGAAYVGVSDPGLPDTDDDGIGDGDEYFLDLNPRSADTDEDGLLDNLELEFDSDPTLANPDDDSYDDAEEYDRGSDPLAYDLNHTEAIAAFGAGAAAGEWEWGARYVGRMSDEQLQS